MIKILVLIFKVNVGVETAESSKQVLWRKYNSHNKIYSTDCAESICTMYTYLRFFASPFRVQTESFQSCSLQTALLLLSYFPFSQLVSILIGMPISQLSQLSEPLILILQIYTCPIRICTKFEKGRVNKTTEIYAQYFFIHVSSRQTHEKRNRS